jgi:hypothetical protein
MKTLKHTHKNIFLSSFIVIGICSFLFTSCHKDELLNPDPSTLITDTAAFDTTERIENQVNGLYSRLKADSFLGSRYFLISEVRAGDFISTNLNAATGATSYQLNAETTTAEVGAIWERGYQAINASNVFIDKMNAIGMEVTGEQLGNSYIAEARLIRSLANYYLLQLYARPYLDGNGSKPGLPLRLQGNTEPGNYDLARSSVKETYDQIIKDLDFAEANLPEAYSSAFLNTTRAHKNSAIALKTRVYLSMHDYPNVITEANKIVSANSPFQAPSGVKNALASDIHEVYQAPYTTSESIFSMPFTNQDSPGISMPAWYLPGQGDGGTATSNGDGGYSLNPNGIPADPNWTVNDDRRDFLFKGTKSNKLWLTKFSQASPYTDYIPVIRYSEVLLNLAEALTRNTNSVDAKAVELLSTVRNRADATIQFSTSDFANDAELINTILIERHIEFLGEGNRNADIMRLGINIPAKPTHSVAASSPSDYNYIFPIPIDELNLNKLMTNN